MLPVVLPRDQVLELLDDAEQRLELEIDLAAQQVIRHDGSSFSFEVDEFRKHCLLNGFDDIGLTMEKMDQIRGFEASTQPACTPWPVLLLTVRCCLPLQAVRSEHFPWLDGATTRVPKLFAVQEADMPTDTPSHRLETPTPEQWRAEVIATHQQRQQQAQHA